MKRCPACSRVYDDDGLRFCLDDGTNLIDKSPAAPVPTTLILPASEESAPTMKQVLPPDVPPLYAQPGPTSAATHGKRSVLLWVIAVALLIPFVAGAVAGGLVIFKKRASTWHLVLELAPSPTNREDAVQQTVKVIESRLDAIGVSHFEVKPQGGVASGRILVNLPNVADPERLKQIITAGGKLELVHVVGSASPSPVQKYATKEEAIASLKGNGVIPQNRRVLPYTERSNLKGPTEWVVVESPPIVDGSELRNASAVRSGYGEDYQIAFWLRKVGADKFGAWTGANINEYLGVVLNDEVKSIAFIKSQIFDAGEITGNFTKQSAEDLALVLKSGALPAPVTIVEEHIDK